MKLIRVIFLALPFFVNNTNAASTIVHMKGNSVPSLPSNFYQVKGTHKDNPYLNSTGIGRSKGKLIESMDIIEDSSKLLDWRAKIINSFNKKQLLKLKSSNSPLLAQDNRIKTKKNTAAKLSENVKWYITAGHFRTKANAIAFVSRLKKLGFSVLIQPLTKGTSVLIGPYDFRPHAVISMQELRNNANVRGAIIHFKYSYG
ncbi:agglutination protein [Legionella busanensis]|uniref:Agglutination protein n=1 Tax=Legionella busanensis TaxID=190655 RepID=A0A378JK76_9GAMM|nr:SPOR domain-containing protein [Legionella busanensis]STX51141.1 agglutination protein [Legionella busanensis]